MKFTLRVVVLLALLALVGCAPFVERDGGGSVSSPAAVADAVPRDEPKSKYGNAPSYVVFNKRYYTLETAAGYSERGIASWYGKKFHGRKTSNGEIYDMYKMTAAHKALPLPTYVQVTNLANGRQAVLRVNDRGPFHANRIIDLSYAAALKLGMTEAGTAFVEVRAVDAHGRPIGPVVANAGKDPGIAPGVYMQVASFQDPSNARRLADQIGRVVSDRVHVREVNASGRTLHRVQIGPIASVALADTIVSALAEFGLGEHHFIGN